MAGEAEFVRTGLLGFLGPGGLVFVCGSRDGLMSVSGRKHNTDDIIATVLAVEPMRLALLLLLMKCANSSGENLLNNLLKCAASICG